MSSLLIAGAIASLSSFNVYAVLNAAGTSYAVADTTNGTFGCTTTNVCIMLGSSAGNNDHGQFNGDPTPGIGCRAFNPAQSVQLNAPMTTPTLISALTWAGGNPSPLSSLCTSAAGANTWQIFKSSNGTIWAVKLNASFQIPTTLTLGTNIKECQSTWNFDTTNGCTPAPIPAPIDFSFNHKQPEIFATEIELK